MREQLIYAVGYGILIVEFFFIMRFLLRDFRHSLANIAAMQNVTNLLLGQLAKMLVMHDARQRGVNGGEIKKAEDYIIWTEYRKLSANIDAMNRSLGRFGERSEHER